MLWFMISLFDQSINDLGLSTKLLQIKKNMVFIYGFDFVCLFVMLIYTPVNIYSVMSRCFSVLLV